ASAALALGAAWTNIVIDSTADAVAKKCLPVMRRLLMIPLTLQSCNIAKICGRCKRVSGFSRVTNSETVKPSRRNSTTSFRLPHIGLSSLKASRVSTSSPRSALHFWQEQFSLVEGVVGARGADQISVLGRGDQK